MKAKRIVSFDAESNGLHGEVFALGGVVLDRESGEVLEKVHARVMLFGPVDPWVRTNVLPALAEMEVTHTSGESGFAIRAARTDFWKWLTEVMVDALVVVDCGWPVEAGLLSACVEDDPTRAFKGPYPLHEVATLLLAAGFDPLASYGELLLPGRGDEKHNPVYDAHVSALCARMALEKLGL